jgi:spore cortex formation protein SpoVR/YcgB (stage V sporulation)
MGALIIPLLLFFQDGGQNPAQQSIIDAQRREAALRSVPETLGRESITTSEAVRKDSAFVQERLFVEKFNRLMYALMDFADDYKARQTINVKKAKAVREAWNKLEKAEALFQDDKKK